MMFLLSVLIKPRNGVQVPRSSNQITEDADYSLFSVCLFRRVVDSFKNEARQKGYQVRPLLEPTSVCSKIIELQVIRASAFPLLNGMSSVIAISPECMFILNLLERTRVCLLSWLGS